MKNFNQLKVGDEVKCIKWSFEFTSDIEVGDIYKISGKSFWDDMVILKTPTGEHHMGKEFFNKYFSILENEKKPVEVFGIVKFMEKINAKV